MPNIDGQKENSLIIIYLFHLLLQNGFSTPSHSSPRPTQFFMAFLRADGVLGKGRVQRACFCTELGASAVSE